MKKVSFNESKNTIFFYDDCLYTCEILDIIMNYFTSSIRIKLRYRNMYDSQFKEIFDTIEWIERNYKNEEFDEYDVMFTIFAELKNYDNFNDIKNTLLNYDFNVFNKCSFHNFEI